MSQIILQGLALVRFRKVIDSPAQFGHDVESFKNSQDAQESVIDEDDLLEIQSIHEIAIEVRLPADEANRCDKTIDMFGVAP